MIKLADVFGNITLLAELIALVTGIVHYKRFKDTYWKWFIFYLGFIFLAETVSAFVLIHYTHLKKSYYALLVIPVEFLFFYWLFAYKSLKNKKLFWISTVIYLVSFIPHYTVFKSSSLVNSFNYIVGAFLLMIMIVLEFNKQIKNDDILLFRSNMMFYINTGVCLLYVGTLPFFSFFGLLLKDPLIWSNYYVFFLCTNFSMYILFSFALLWGKPNTY
ncbi:hypothetical protein [Flavobacterium sp.]